MGKDGIKMDQEKVKAILDWPAPSRIKGVRSFVLGSIQRKLNTKLSYMGDTHIETDFHEA